MKSWSPGKISKILVVLSISCLKSRESSLKKYNGSLMKYKVSHVGSRRKKVPELKRRQKLRFVRLTRQKFHQSRQCRRTARLTLKTWRGTSRRIRRGRRGVIGIAWGIRTRRGGRGPWLLQDNNRVRWCFGQEIKKEMMEMLYVWILWSYCIIKGKIFSSSIPAEGSFCDLHTTWPPLFPVLQRSCYYLNAISGTYI